MPIKIIKSHVYVVNSPMNRINVPMIMFLNPHISLFLESILAIPSIIRNNPIIQTIKPSIPVNSVGLNESPIPKK